MQSILIASILVSWAAAIYVWSRRSAPGAIQLTLLMMMIGWWGIPFLLRDLWPDATTRLLALKLEYVSVVTVPLLLLWFALSYAGKEAWLTPFKALVLVAVPAITLVLALTTESHNLIVDFGDTPFHPEVMEYVTWKRGLWGWINTYYQYAIIASGTVILARRLFTLHPTYRPQVLPMLITTGIAWGVNILYAFEMIPPVWPIAPLSFMIFGLGIIWSLYRHQLLDVVPVARDVLIEGMSDAVFVLDTQERIVGVNPAGQRMFPKISPALIGTKIDRVLPNLADLLHEPGEDLARHKIERAGKAGERHIYDANVSVLYNRQHHITGYLCVLRDVTELEAARQQAQAADRAKSEFLSNVSHELRTPLTSVKLYLNLIKSGRADRLETYLDSIRREVDRLQILIEGVLTLSRLDLGKIIPQTQDVDLNALLSTLFHDRKPLFEQRGLTLTIQIEPALPPVNADPQLIEQVITNLLSNAMHYTPSGGGVRLATARSDNEHHHWATITVEDTGLGISDKEQQRIFERFRRGAASQATQTPGTGLGLAISQEIVHLHHGRITLKSQEGVGSIFTVWLPLD